MAVNPLVLALGQSLPNIAKDIEASRQKKRKEETLEDIFKIQKNPDLNREEKLDLMGTKILPFNAKVGFSMIDNANQIRDQKVAVKNELMTKTRDQQIKFLTPLLSKATTAEQVNAIVQKGGLSDIINSFDEGTEFVTKTNKFKTKNLKNPYNNNLPGFAYVYDDGTIVFQKKEIGEGSAKQVFWLEPAPSLEKTQKVVSEAELFRDPKYKIATKAQKANPNLEGRIYTPEGSEKSFIKIVTLPKIQTDAILQFDKVATGLASSIKTMKQKGLAPDPITGRIPLIGEFINVMTKSPEWQTWASGVDRLFQDYRKIVTGAQASDAEIQRLIPLMPTSKDKDNEVFTMKALQVINEMQNTRSRVLQVYESQGYDIGGFGASAVGPPVSAATGTSKPAARISYGTYEEAKLAIEGQLGRALTDDESDKLKTKFGGL